MANKTLEVVFWKENTYIFISTWYEPLIDIQTFFAETHSCSPLVLEWTEISTSGPLESRDPSTARLNSCNTRLGRWALVDCGNMHCSRGLVLGRSAGNFNSLCSRGWRSGRSGGLPVGRWRVKPNSVTHRKVWPQGAGLSFLETFILNSILHSSLQ
jgi:hypothetical protein